jgi:hypothetical protein
VYPEAFVKDIQATRKAFSPKKKHPALQKMKFVNCFLILWAIFALLDPDADPGTPLNPDPIRIHATTLKIHYYIS